MWEQRYGFPEPQRTPVGLPALPARTTSRRCAASRPAPPRPVDPRRDRARAGGGRGLRPPVDLRRGRREARRAPAASCASATLIALSRAIEHETLAHAAAPVLFAAFQRESFYRDVERRYRRLAAARRRGLRLRRLPGVPRRSARRADRGPDRRATTRWATSGRSSSTRPARRLPAGLGAARRHGAGQRARPRPPLRGDLDRRPRGHPAAPRWPPRGSSAAAPRRRGSA